MAISIYLLPFRCAHSLPTFPCHKLTLFLVTCSSLTTVSIGYTDGFISPSSTSTFTNRITNGSVRFYTSTVWVTLTKSPPSSYAICIACLPPFGWLHAIDTLSPLHLHFPYSSSRVPCSIRPSQYVEYICEHLPLSYLGSYSGPGFACQIHDSDMITGHFLEKFINGPAHHTLHHLYFTVNYGQVRLVPLAFSWFWFHTLVLYMGRSCWRIISSPRICTGSSDGSEVVEGRMK